MSSNTSCLFIQIKPAEWYCVLEHRNAPKNAYDWREHATGYGPFPTEAAATRYVFDQHGNPGGAEIEELPAGVLERDLDEDPLLRQLIAAAPGNTRRNFNVR